MFFHRIQNRLIFLFVGLVIIILITSGWTLHWMIRQNLEKELGSKLTAVASAVSVMLDDEEIQFLIQSPGARFRHRLRQRIEKLKHETQVKHIYLFDLESRSLLDTDEQIKFGENYFALQFYLKEIEQIKQGKTAQSILFSGIDDQPTKTGFAPLRMGQQIIGGVAVDGQAAFLGGVRRVRDRLYLIGILSSITAIFLGIVMARSITLPMEKLIHASQKIGRGNYSQPIQVDSKDEIQLLAETMDDMRQNIIQRERELKAMVAGVAHEIRNPLGGIELFTGILSDEVSKNKKAKSQIDRISSEVQYLKTIVERFLTFARPTDPRCETCNLKRLLDEIVELHRKEIEDKGIQINFSGPFDNIQIFADPMHLKQIFMNVIQNAIQAEKENGGITININKKAEKVFLLIHNTGEPIPQEMEENIFTPFFTTREKGTGLGLSIAKQLTEKNGGLIRLVRSDKKGTEFEIQFQLINS